MAGQPRLLRGLHGVIRVAQGQLRLPKNASPASVGTTPLALRCNSRVDSSPSSRLICWLRADVTMPMDIAARPMLPASTTRTK